MNCTLQYQDIGKISHLKILDYITFLLSKEVFYNRDEFYHLYLEA